MAEYSDFLMLVLPARGEYRETWHVPMNANSVKVDTWSKAINEEILAARGQQTSLHEFLAVGHDNTGENLPSPEGLSSRNSPLYGDMDGSTGLVLNTRLDKGDWEVFHAREAQASLRDALALRQAVFPNMIIAGSKNSNGYPTWLSFNAGVARVDGSGTPVLMSVNGHISRVRTLKEATVPGPSATFYLYATYEASGVVTVDGDSSTPPPALPQGITSTESINDPARLFSDPTIVDWNDLDVKAGDLLALVDSGDKGTYVIQEILGTDPSKLKIVGHFPVGGISNINYTIKDPLGATLGFATTDAEVDGRIILGEVDVDGSSSITAARARHFKDTFTGEWQSVNTAGAALPFEKSWYHCLGSVNLEIAVQASQANDGSSPVEELSLATVDSSTLTVAADKGTLAISTDISPLSVPVTGLSISCDKGTLAGSGGVTITGAPTATPSGTMDVAGSVSNTVSGTPTASVTNGVTMDRSVKAKWTKNQIWVKNIVPTVFYRDYEGSARQTGYIRAVVRKRG